MKTRLMSLREQYKIKLNNADDGSYFYMPLFSVAVVMVTG